MQVTSLRAEVQALRWFHSIDLGDGIVTPGFPRDPFIDRALAAVDFTGRRVLDIGCWDGLWAFEAERRGAREVVAVDDVSQRPWSDQPTLETARRALGSRVEYHPDVSVYQLPRLPVRDFDTVLCFGVHYHLKHPLLALARVRQVMAAGGLLLLEGEVLNDRRSCHAEFFYHAPHAGDPSNWWVPTIPCLRSWLECSFFEIESVRTPLDDWFAGPFPSLRRQWAALRGRWPKFTRCLIAARAVQRQDKRYVFADDELRGCDLNEYP